MRIRPKQCWFWFSRSRASGSGTTIDDRNRGAVCGVLPARLEPVADQQLFAIAKELTLSVGFRRVVAQFQSPRGFRALYVTTTEFALRTQAFLELSARFSTSHLMMASTR